MNFIVLNTKCLFEFVFSETIFFYVL
jgi:hypothetical protein